MIKKKLKTILTLIICPLFIYSCAGLRNLGKEKFEAELNQLAKRDINEAIEALGPPTKEYTLPNGSKMYSWVRAKGFKIYSSGGVNESGMYSWYSWGGNGYYDNTRYGTPLYCEIDLTANSLGKIVRWTYRGNACY